MHACVCMHACFVGKLMSVRKSPHSCICVCVCVFVLFIFESMQFVYEWVWELDETSWFLRDFAIENWQKNSAPSPPGGIYMYYFLLSSLSLLWLIYGLYKALMQDTTWRPYLIGACLPACLSVCLYMYMCVCVCMCGYAWHHVWQVVVECSLYFRKISHQPIVKLTRSSTLQSISLSSARCERCHDRKLWKTKLAN